MNDRLQYQIFSHVNCTCRCAVTVRSDVRAIDNSLPAPRGVGGQRRMTYFSLYIHVMLILASHRYIFPFYCRLFVLQTCQWKCCCETGCSGLSLMGRRFVCLFVCLHYLYAAVSLTLHTYSLSFTAVIYVKYSCA